MTTFKKTVKATTPNEWIDDLIAVIEIDAALAKQIRQLAQEVKRLQVYKLSQFLCLPAWHEMAFDDVGEECPGDEVRTECVAMQVYEDRINWSCTRKHQLDPYQTDSIYFSELFPAFNLSPLDESLPALASTVTPEGAELSPAQHVEEGGVRCPVCLSEDREGYSVATGGGSAGQSFYCSHCHAEWDDEYVLTGYTNLKVAP